MIPILDTIGHSHLPLRSLLLLAASSLSGREDI
jgi:hypothetical protein